MDRGTFPLRAGRIADRQESGDRPVKNPRVARRRTASDLRGKTLSLAVLARKQGAVLAAVLDHPVRSHAREDDLQGTDQVLVSSGDDEERSTVCAPRATWCLRLPPGVHAVSPRPGVTVPGRTAALFQTAEVMPLHDRQGNRGLPGRMKSGTDNPSSLPTAGPGGPSAALRRSRSEKWRGDGPVSMSREGRAPTTSRGLRPRLRSAGRSDIASPPSRGEAGPNRSPEGDRRGFAAGPSEGGRSHPPS